MTYWDVPNVFRALTTVVISLTFFTAVGILISLNRLQATFDRIERKLRDRT